jgi:hypothetical protein
MAAKSTRKKLTPAQIKEQTKKIQEAIDKHKREHRDEHFTSLTPEEIERKLKRVNSPMIVSQGWGSTTPGGTFNYSVGIQNPDPTSASNLYVHVWVGSGNVDPTVGTFLFNVDTRFPRLTQPAFFGLSLASGANATLSFSIKVPTTVEKTNYLGNSFLMRLNYHDVGQYLDRGVFPFAVT